MTHDQQPPDTDEDQSFQFQIRDMLLATLVAALFFGLLGSVPGGVFVASVGTVSCGTWILLQRRGGRYAGTQDYVEMLKFAIITFLLECLFGWVTGFLYLILFGMVAIYPLALTRLLAVPFAGLNCLGSLWQIRRRRHGLVHAVIWFAAAVGFFPFVGVPAMFAGHLHRLGLFDGRHIAAECLQMLRDENRQGDPLPPAIARLDPLKVNVLPDSVRIDNITSGYTFEKLDSNGNWVLRVWWDMPGEHQTAVATIHEDEFR